MRCYLVGGAVRDRLSGRPVVDRDWVVVGATAEEMVAQGFTPVGKDFPVFLHPRTHEEYALARTERKTAPGYRGFTFHADPDVTLEEDLARRDLTVNAMAQADDGQVIDPFGGRADLQQRVLRHVAPAFVEDPVRILRVARFAARFTDFTVAAQTMALMRAMVAQGEVDALVPERVWQEFARGLMEALPSRMIDVLREAGAFARLVPQLEQLWQAANGSDAAMAAVASLDAAAHAGSELPVRVAVLLQALATAPAAARSELDVQAIEAVCAGLKVPAECRDLAVATGRERATIEAGAADAALALAVLERCDALRKSKRFGQLLEAMGFLGRGVSGPRPAILARWQAVLGAARAVDAGAVALGVPPADPARAQTINAGVRAARVAAIKAILAVPASSPINI